MRNARLDESQAGIMSLRKNINNLRYADDTTLMAEREEEHHLSMKVKEESKKAGLKLYIQNTQTHTHTRTGNRREKSRSSDRFYFLGPQNHCGQ